MLSLGTLIWVSCRPLIRLVLCVGCGFAMTKADIFPIVAARGTGQIILNIALPCLMFSKIVPAFTSDNINALGPLVLVAVLYELMGILIAWIGKQFFWVPHRFRHGILVAGGWGNYGDIPTSVIMSITGAAPFNGIQDQNLSVAYISAFILVFFITLFPLGGHRWIAQDYIGPDVEVNETRELIRIHRRTMLTAWIPHGLKIARGTESASIGPADIEKDNKIHYDKSEVSNPEDPYAILSPTHNVPRTPQNRHVYFRPDNATTITPTEVVHSQICSPAPTEISPSRIASPAPTFTHVEHNPVVEDSQKTTDSSVNPGSQHSSRRRKVIITKIRTFLRSLFMPSSIVIIIAFPIALIPPLKALFTPGVPNTHIPNAPDGQPPLAFLLDTTSFIGAASVPLGLITLGSALARLHVSRNDWKSMPLGAIAWLAVGKIMVMPVFGVLICQGLVSAGLIDREDKVLRFVCIFFSCLPTATTQVFLTQVYSGTGSADHLPAFLIPQYILMFVSMTILTAYSLQLLF